MSSTKEAATAARRASARCPKAVEVADILVHVICDLKKSGSSCGQQLAFGIRQALMIINGTACTGCSGTTCVNMK